MRERGLEGNHRYRVRSTRSPARMRDAPAKGKQGTGASSFSGEIAPIVWGRASLTGIVVHLEPQNSLGRRAGGVSPAHAGGSPLPARQTNFYGST